MGGLSTAPLLRSIAIDPVSLVFERNGSCNGLDKSQQFEMLLCSIAFEFLPCYNRFLLAQAKLNPSFSIVGG